MLSHLRFHRRGPSNPPSPNTDLPPSPWDHNSYSQSSLPSPSQPLPQPPPSLQDATSSPTNPDSRPQSSNSAALHPPVLPPIARVTSGESPPSEPQSLTDARALDTTMDKESKMPKQPVRSPFNEGSGFMGGVALQKYRREQQQLLEQQQQQQPWHHHQPPVLPKETLANPSSAATAPTLEPPSRTTPQGRSPGLPSPDPKAKSVATRPATSFAAPTEIRDHTYQPSQPRPATGKRPAGARLATEPASIPAAAAANNNMNRDAGVDAPKGRRGLPFLKNPMSTLLMRRKMNQNAPDVAPLPLHPEPQEPAYDPRIRGTRVHDFSAPRHRKPVPSSVTHADLEDKDKAVLSKTSSRDALDPAHTPLQARHKSSASDSGQSGTASQFRQDAASMSSSKTRRSSNIEQKPLPGEPPIVPPKDDDRAPKENTATGGHKGASVSASMRSISKRASSSVLASGPSTRTTQSRNVSLSGKSARDVLSSIPRHMKSTSSRFSFDMIGAAKQEKVLEERHRQRELERQTADPDPEDPDPNRDSRFDDFDEDALYDAMMDDDGLEERIPGVNADYDGVEEDIPEVNAGYDGFEEDIPGANADYDGLEEDTPGVNADCDVDFDSRVPVVNVEDEGPLKDQKSNTPPTEKDPNDDQENFSGFVFQRSNTASQLNTPRSAGMLITPRDAEGNAIGFAKSRDTPNMRGPVSPAGQDDQRLSQLKPDDDQIAGLGIQGLDLNDRAVDVPKAAPAVIGAPPPEGSSSRPKPVDDDLYFEGGLMDDIDEFAGQGDGSTFDESLFDLDDTDQYGRPIPGAFAAAQATRAARASEAGIGAETAATKQESKRVSDSTSRHSAHSEVSQSTAHTSLSVGLQHYPSLAEKRETDTPQVEKQEKDPSPNAAGLEGLGAGPSVMSDMPSSEQGTMAAYQAALAAAAHEAAARGKFRRDSSPSLSELRSPEGNDTGNSHGMGGNNEFDDDEFGHDEFGYDDMDDYDFDDDAIAEANADALASDCDGWYGQEFGFYSAPQHQRHSRDSSGGGGGGSANGASLSGSGEGPGSGGNGNGSGGKPFEFANGGYFGPSGFDRSKSTRTVSREPNLTPITERSEYSNRNSIMSLTVPPALGSANGPPSSTLQSPGLAQLAALSDGGADDSGMSLSALMRLRSRAWGSSQISLSSSREGSPKSERADGASSPSPSPWGSAAGDRLSAGSNLLGIYGAGPACRHHHHQHARKGSAFSVRSRDFESSEAGSATGSPTMTMAALPVTSPPGGSVGSGQQAVPPLSVSSPLSMSASVASPPLEASFGPLLVPRGEKAVPGTGPEEPVVDSPEAMTHPNLPLVTSPWQHGRPGSGPGGHGHKHKGSADSISYVREEEGWDGGEPRWVMERRYTADSGEVEVEREVLEQGRI